MFTKWSSLCEIGSSFTLQWISTSECQTAKSRSVCEIPAAQQLFGSDHAVCRLPRITAIEFQSKNFRLGTGLFVHAAYAAHVAVIQPGLSSHMHIHKCNRHREDEDVLSENTVDFLLLLLQDVCM